MRITNLCTHINIYTHTRSMAWKMLGKWYITSNIYYIELNELMNWSFTQVSYRGNSLSFRFHVMMNIHPSKAKKNPVEIAISIHTQFSVERAELMLPPCCWNYVRLKQCYSMLFLQWNMLSIFFLSVFACCCCLPSQDSFLGLERHLYVYILIKYPIWLERYIIINKFMFYKRRNSSKVWRVGGHD